MKKYVLIIILLLGYLPSLKAQNDKQQRIQALYVAFVTKQLDLTSDEAQKFWPVHTKFLNEMKVLRTDLPELDKQQAVLDIKKRYQNNFSKIIGPDRTEKFFKINSEFNKKLLERIKKQRAQPNPKKEM